MAARKREVHEDHRVGAWCLAVRKKPVRAARSTFGFVQTPRHKEACVYVSLIYLCARCCLVGWALFIAMFFLALSKALSSFFSG